MSAAVFTVLTAMFMCGCTSDKNTVGQSTEYNGRGGRTPAETAFLTDGKEKVCYGQGYETDSDNRPVGAVQAPGKIRVIRRKIHIRQRRQDDLPDV